MLYNPLDIPSTAVLPAKAELKSDDTPARVACRVIKADTLDGKLSKADLKKGPTYHLEVEVEGPNFGWVPRFSLTFPVALTIGNDTGTTSVTVNGRRDD